MTVTFLNYAFFIAAFNLLIGQVLYGQDTATMANSSNPLQPVRTETPQDTMKTFMEAMEQYRIATDKGDEATRQFALGRAVRTLDLKGFTPILQSEAGIEAAIYLKEVIDRVVKVDYRFIPPGELDPTLRSPWRLIDTDIKIVKMSEGDRSGEYLFSQDTVSRIKQFYDLVKFRPYKEGTGGGARYRAPWLQERVPRWLQGEFLGIKSWQLLGGFIAILLGLAIRRLSLGMTKLIHRLASKSRTTLDDELIQVIQNPLSWILAAIFWFLMIKFLQFEGMMLSALSTLVQILFSASAIWTFYRLVAVFSSYFESWLKDSDVAIDEQLIPLINKSIRLFVVIFGTLIALQNLGINVMSLIAGLGLGGLAFALAAKDTAANLFGSLMIFSDSPFRVGEWVKFGDIEGTVEAVGFRSTKVRTFYNSLITIPNAQVASHAIDNMGRREFRRIVSSLHLKMDTPAEVVEAFLEGVKNIIKANDHTRKDYFHVILKGYSEFSLEVMLYLFLKVPDWGQELVERQNLFLEISRLAHTLGIKFAYPTQDIGLHQRHQVARQQLDAESLKAIAKDFGKDGRKSRPRGYGIFRAPFLE